MDRQQWLAKRDSGSLGQFYRSREHFLHVSRKFIVNPAAELAKLTGKVFTGPYWLPLPGETFTLRRNKAKRERRAGKPRKQRRRLA